MVCQIQYIVGGGHSIPNIFMCQERVHGILQMSQIVVKLTTSKHAPNVNSQVNYQPMGVVTSLPPPTFKVGVDIP